MKNKKALIIVALIAFIILVGVILLISKNGSEKPTPELTVSESIASETEIKPDSNFTGVDWDEFEAENDPNFDMSTIESRTGLILPKIYKICVIDPDYPCFDAAITIDKKEVPQLLDQMSGDTWEKNSDFSSIPIWEKYDTPEGSGLYRRSTPSTINKGINTTFVVILPSQDPDMADVLIWYSGE